MSFFSALTSLIGSGSSTAKPWPISNGEEHNQYYNEAWKLIQPYLRLAGAMDKKADTQKARAKLERAIALLHEVVVYNPGNWSAFWLLGKAYQTMDDHQKAYNFLGKSYGIQKENPDVAREYMFECLELTKADEGVTVGEQAVSLRPMEAGLHANLALAYMIAGRMADARSAVDKALQLDSSDQISLAVRRRIQQVAEGTRLQPRTIRDLE